MTSTASSTDWTSLTLIVNSVISGEAGALARPRDEGGRRTSQRVGHGVPGVLVWSLCCFMISWVGCVG